MPKSIDNLKNTILTEAKRLVLTEGYEGMTLRSVAKSCGIAVGTIYNYYPSKDVLIASFMLDDWLEALERMKKITDENAIDAFFHVYSEIISYSDKYMTLFSDKNARKSAGDVFYMRHKTLRAQIAETIGDVCRKKAKKASDHLPEFVAETLLSHASERRDFRELADILEQLFN